MKTHLWTLPRWFAAPFFGGSVLLGSLLTGELSANTWIALAAGLLIMAGGHSFNTLLDYTWTGLDKGNLGERSAEKAYCGGQSVIASGLVSERAVFFNAITWDLLAAILVIYLSRTSLVIIPLAAAGMLVTVWYSKSKFNWTHELALGVGVGPIPLLIGMYAVNPSPPVGDGLLASVLFAILLSFLGLALDEWPDAEANLKKGVRSIAYKVWQYNSLEWYVSSWTAILYIYQVFLITLGVLKPLTGLTFLVLPPIVMLMVPLRSDFRKIMGAIIAVASLYPILLVAGQIWG